MLLKRSGNSLNKEWKKKYVTLSNDGILSYHASVNVSPRANTMALGNARLCTGGPTLTAAVWLGRTTC